MVAGAKESLWPRFDSVGGEDKPLANAQVPSTRLGPVHIITETRAGLFFLRSTQDEVRTAAGFWLLLAAAAAADAVWQGLMAGSWGSLGNPFPQAQSRTQQNEPAGVPDGVEVQGQEGGSQPHRTGALNPN